MQRTLMQTIGYSLLGTLCGAMLVAFGMAYQASRTVDVIVELQAKHKLDLSLRYCEGYSKGAQDVIGMWEHR